MALADAFSPSPAKSPGNVLRSNAFTNAATGDNHLYELMSRANHSCSPNMSRTFDGHTDVVSMLRGVARGEALTVSYLRDGDLARPTEERYYLLSLLATNHLLLATYS